MLENNGCLDPSPNVCEALRLLIFFDTEASGPTWGTFNTVLRHRSIAADEQDWALRQHHRLDSTQLAMCLLLWGTLLSKLQRPSPRRAPRASPIPKRRRSCESAAGDIAVGVGVGAAGTSSSASGAL